MSLEMALLKLIDFDTGHGGSHAYLADVSKLHFWKCLKFCVQHFPMFLLLTKAFGVACLKAVHLNIDCFTCGTGVMLQKILITEIKVSGFSSLSSLSSTYCLSRVHRLQHHSPIDRDWATHHGNWSYVTSIKTSTTCRLALLQALLTISCVLLLKDCAVIAKIGLPFLVERRSF